MLPRIKDMSTDMIPIPGSDRPPPRGAQEIGPNPPDEIFDVTVRLRRRAELPVTTPQAGMARMSRDEYEASHGATRATAATIRVRPDPSTNAVTAPAQSSSTALIPYTPAMGAKRDSQVSVWEYPSDSHENPDRNQPRHHSISSHAAGTATSHRTAPVCGSQRATTYPSAA